MRGRSPRARPEWPGPPRPGRRAPAQVQLVDQPVGCCAFRSYTRPVHGRFKPFRVRESAHRQGRRGQPDQLQQAGRWQGFGWRLGVSGCAACAGGSGWPSAGWPACAWPWSWPWLQSGPWTWALAARRHGHGHARARARGRGRPRCRRRLRARTASSTSCTIRCMARSMSASTWSGSIFRWSGLSSIGTWRLPRW